MINLTQRAWNNVIIFAMLFMVYLFSISNELIIKNNDDDQVRFLFPEHSVIMQIKFSEVTLERIGQSWRTQGSDQWSMNSLQSLVHNWSKLIVHEQEYTSLNNPYIVTLLLAGEENNRVLQVSSVTDGVMINSGAKSYLVPETNMDELVPL